MYKNALQQVTSFKEKKKSIPNEYASHEAVVLPKEHFFGAGASI